MIRGRIAWSAARDADLADGAHGRADLAIIFADCQSWAGEESLLRDGSPTQVSQGADFFFKNANLDRSLLWNCAGCSLTSPSESGEADCESDERAELNPKHYSGFSARICTSNARPCLECEDIRYSRVSAFSRSMATWLS